MWGTHHLVRLAAWLSGLAAVLLCFVVIAERIQPKPDLQPAFPGYRVLADVPLSGGSSRFDYQSFDASSQRLYVAHPEAGTITVFDAATGEVLRDITGLTDVHGVLAVPEYNRLFATEQSLSALAVIDTQTFDVVAEAPAGEGPDSLAYAPEERRVFVADERGGMVTVIDVSSEEPVAQISVGSRLGIIQYDAARHRVLVVSGASNELAEIDPASNAITEEHTIAGCAGAHSLYLNDAADTAYVGCEDNARLLTLDLDSMQITGRHTVGNMPDILAFDPGLNRLYVGSESGIVTAFQAMGNVLHRLASANPGVDAHSVAVDPTTHAVFVPLASVDGRPVLRILGPSAPPSSAS